MHSLSLPASRVVRSNFVSKGALLHLKVELGLKTAVASHAVLPTAVGTGQKEAVYVE